MIVTPLLKKLGLDAADKSNYHPVSILVSWNELCVANDLLPRYQSAYLKQHSTETAMLRVWSDILTAADT